jgi:hypothetical protein
MGGASEGRERRAGLWQKGRERKMMVLNLAGGSHE